jgi:hypothetical protein
LKAVVAKEKKIHVKHLKSTLPIECPELRRYNYEILSDYDALPVEIIKTQNSPPPSFFYKTTNFTA